MNPLLPFFVLLTDTPWYGTGGRSGRSNLQWMLPNYVERWVAFAGVVQLVRHPEVEAAVHKGGVALMVGQSTASAWACAAARMGEVALPVGHCVTMAFGREHLIEIVGWELQSHMAVAGHLHSWAGGRSHMAEGLELLPAQCVPPGPEDSSNCFQASADHQGLVRGFVVPAFSFISSICSFLPGHLQLHLQRHVHDVFWTRIQCAEVQLGRNPRSVFDSVKRATDQSVRQK
jgi:hypothetical protein